MSVELNERIHAFPGDHSEVEWLDTLEFLRTEMGKALATVVHMGRYWIDDSPSGASAGGCAEVRARGPVPGVESDSWEGILCWTGNRAEKRGWSDVVLFPFFNGSAVMRRGRLADLGPGAEIDEYLNYRFIEGHYVQTGWEDADGPGEWAGVTKPGTLYSPRLAVISPSVPCVSRSPILVDLELPGLSKFWAKEEQRRAARISLIHVNRNREGTNLVPWTARPPFDNCPDAKNLDECRLIAPDTIRLQLDTFRIRGGWIPGNYYLSIRVQNVHQPGDWTWSGEISKPFEFVVK